MKNSSVSANRMLCGTFRLYNWIWNNVNSRIISLPKMLEREILFRIPYQEVDIGTEFSIQTRKASIIYIAQQEGEKCGWSRACLQENGWKELHSTVDVNLIQKHKNGIVEGVMVELKLWHKKSEKNQEIIIPATTTEQTIAAIFVAEGEYLYWLYNKGDKE